MHNNCSVVPHCRETISETRREGSEGATVAIRDANMLCEGRHCEEVDKREAC